MRTKLFHVLCFQILNFEEGYVTPVPPSFEQLWKGLQSWRTEYVQNFSTCFCFRVSNSEEGCVTPAPLHLNNLRKGIKNSGTVLRNLTKYIQNYDVLLDLAIQVGGGGVM